MIRHFSKAMPVLTGREELFMLNKCLAFILVLCLSSFPIVSAAEESLFLEIDFDAMPERDAERFETFYESTAEIVNGFTGNGLRLQNDTGNLALARLSLGQYSQSSLSVQQTISCSDNETYIRLMASEKTVLTVALSNRQIKAMGKNGWVPLRGYVENTWYTVKIDVDLSKQTYGVMVNGIKAGSMLSCAASGNPDMVQYSVAGTGALLLDDIYITTAKATGSTAFAGAHSDTGSRNAYYASRKPYLDTYQKPEGDYLPGEVTGGTATVSSYSEGYGLENLLDDDEQTKWQAAPPAVPVDNGKSLRIIKPTTTMNAAVAQYSFTPVKSKLIIEQDVLVTDVTDEKALPYVYSSNGNNATSLIQSGGDFSLAGGGGTLYRDVSPNTWYNIRIELSIATQSSDIYIDGKLVKQNSSFRQQCADLSRIRYHINSTKAGGLCLDNVKLSYTSPLNSMEEIVLKEDFEGIEAGATRINGWNIGQADAGLVDVGEYRVNSVYTFTQFANINLGRESEVEGAYLKIPEGISLKYTVDVDRSSGAVYSTVQDKTDRYYSGEQIHYFSPARAFNLRVTIYDAVDAMGNQTFAQLSEMRVILKHRTPVDNLAFYADVSVSGERDSRYDKRGINDNIIAEFGNIGEWQSGGETDKWVELSWQEPQTISRIILHDSAKYDDWTKAGVLIFDDGSQIEVGNIRNTGYPSDISFEPKTVSRVRFLITDYEGNAGLSEFQVYSPGGEPDDVEYVEPDMRIVMNKDYCGRWLCINDVDNDGELEYLSARIYDEPLFPGNHYCASIGVQEADGTMLWTWGDPTIGAKAVGSDVPMQVYDIDSDGQLEVLACTDSHLYILDAATGAEEKRYPLPASQYEPGSWASDTIIIADISGKGYASDIIVKTRYTEAWAYTSDWKLIWYVCMPAGMKIGHFPQPIDIDNDGHDEVIVGFSCVDEDGSLIWSLKESQYAGYISRGHKDSLDIINFSLTGDTTEDYIINQKDLDMLNKHIAGEITLTGNKFTAGDTNGDGKIDEEDKALLEQKLAGRLKSFPNKGIPRDEQRFCISPCGGGSNIIMFDGNGDRVWALDDAVHYETVEKANLGLDEHPFQIITGDNEQGQPAAQLKYLSLDGKILGVANSYIRNRQFNPINWTGEGGLDYVFMPTDNVVIDGRFKLRVKPLAPFRGYDSIGMKSYQTGNKKYTCDMDGDGTTDIGNITNENDTIILYVYFNKNGAKAADDIGRGYNISQY